MQLSSKNLTYSCVCLHKYQSRDNGDQSSQHSYYNSNSEMFEAADKDSMFYKILIFGGDECEGFYTFTQYP